MGNSASAAAPSPAPLAEPEREGSYTVRVSPSLMQSSKGDSETIENNAATPVPSNEMLQRAFQQGAEHAAQHFAQQQVEQKQEKLAAMQRANEESGASLAEKIEALHKREYRAPVGTMACQDERDAVLMCYRKTHGLAAGEVVFTCHQAVRDLDLCATLVREAAMAKISSGDFPGK